MRPSAPVVPRRRSALPPRRHPRRRWLTRRWLTRRWLTRRWLTRRWLTRRWLRRRPPKRRSKPSRRRTRPSRRRRRPRLRPQARATTPTSHSAMIGGPAIGDDGGAVRLRLDIAYDGTDFAGWAVQGQQRTVAGVLDDALSTVFRTPVRLFAAGRTDTGVHATGQVAHVDVPVGAVVHARPRRHRPTEPEFLPLVRRLARFLPADVRVREIIRAPAGFDARFSALRRHYVYRVSTAPYGVEPQLSRYVTAWPRPLDVAAMATASKDLVGLHDFAAFCRKRGVATTIRDLQRLDWDRDGDLLTGHVR